MDLDSMAESCAVKISAGGVNALTGRPRDAPTDGRQDYVAVRGDSSGQV